MFSIPILKIRDKETGEVWVVGSKSEDSLVLHPSGLLYYYNSETDDVSGSNSMYRYEFVSAGVDFEGSPVVQMWPVSRVKDLYEYCGGSSLDEGETAKDMYDCNEFSNDVDDKGMSSPNLKLVKGDFSRNVQNNPQMISAFYESEGFLINLDDVQCCEKVSTEFDTAEEHWVVITRNTRWNMDSGVWDNPIKLCGAAMNDFRRAWCEYVDAKLFNRQEE